MTLSEFARVSRLATAEELEKVRLLAFYFHKTSAKTDFTIRDVSDWLLILHLAAPNPSRLRGKLAVARSFIRGKSPNTFRLHAVDLDELQAIYPGLRSGSEDVVSEDTILPLPLYADTRGFVEALAKQINAAYEYNIFDGCAVLMRRLAEVLLILSYEHLNTEASILDSAGNYMPLERIVTDAKTNTKLRLSRNSKAFMDEFRTLGNFAAHKIYFTARRTDVKNVSGEYRALIEELLYKAGIRK
jgi:hypothetical protein